MYTISRNPLTCIFEKVIFILYYPLTKIKKVVGEPRAQAFEKLYQSLGTKKGENSIYRFAKRRERKTIYLDQVKCVEDSFGSGK